MISDLLTRFEIWLFLNGIEPLKTKEIGKIFDLLACLGLSAAQAMDYVRHGQIQGQ
jgi:hypothetical protein